MLKLSNVSIRVDKVSVAEEVSLSIEHGTVHALMGPNGSGKSSLSLALAGHPQYQMIPPAAVVLDGTDILTLLPEDRVKQGLFLTFQNPVAIPGLTVKQLIKLLVDHVRSDKQSVSALLSEMKAYATTLQIKPALLDRYVHDNFSGGEKKRIEMLQLLMARPRYALIDEIDSGLDVDAVRIIGQAVQQAKTEFNTGFLVITHYRRILDYVKPDYVHVLAHGTLLRSGGHELVEEIERNGYQQLVSSG